ncbi:MAG: L-threonylcarbamoyladenylate synthase [Bacteroidales bacterium]|nr:L-threonylcarbamoyladenylate synthase [Bacteroidales bacterium]
MDNSQHEHMLAEIEKTASILRQGGTILYPTDTIWGIGCDATNQKAVEKIYKIKQRVLDKSLLILVDSVQRIYNYVTYVDPLIEDLVQSFDRPLTVIYPNAKNLAKGVAAADRSIGIRMVRDEFCRQLIGKLDKAIVSTSANISGAATPFRFQQISEEVKVAVDYVVDLYHDKISGLKPSRIIRIKDKGDFEVIRS